MPCVAPIIRREMLFQYDYGFVAVVPVGKLVWGRLDPFHATLSTLTGVVM